MAAFYPLIGILLDQEAPGPVPPSYSSFPWYALRNNYMDCIISSGGMPVGLPLSLITLKHLLPRLDGLIIAGGAFDIDPALYHQSPQYHPLILKPNRTQCELYATQYALYHSLPLLGICGGAQLMAVALGGSLVQHIPSHYPNALPHEQPTPRTQASHSINILPDSLLSSITKTTAMAVNSSHHQSILSAGKGTLTAWAEDGVVEAIELPSHPFFLGVQWHPEFSITPMDRKIFTAFIKACTPQNHN
ncbi:gamma-glutamyl-gamma-aminobutyrate hydrolase family protein [Entomobacter blattae]|uniref:Gamma-glutamyl-gamma-aminobutyrate hydrolase PuuD n=1 Tax=Entomobacter blattae TaxID=2762277 RepID=A0A7H1NPM0_9PROT|nr:gamma-glutamyl-gamma-aminobutyrate hydrolase family protein [Entomobacter blattae]QNT77730.1 Gamma-glutamyl-gamma-aminobutyrate hydrolase PuuD [Entomobacter blattae]